MANRRYSDEDKATALAALAANGGNIKQTARDLKLPYGTLRGWASGDNGINHGVTKLQPLKKKALADQLEEIAETIAGSLAGKIDNASLQQAATSLGIVVDKMQLLRGKPTAINEHEVTDARDKLAHLVNRFAARAGEGGDSGGSDE